MIGIPLETTGRPAAERERLGHGLVIGGALGFAAWALLLLGQELVSRFDTPADRGTPVGGTADPPPPSVRAPDDATPVSAERPAGADSGLRAAEPNNDAFTPLGGWPRMDAAEERFGAETVDPDWSRRIEGELLSLLAQFDEFAVHSIEVDCRVSLCRLKLLYPAGVSPYYSIRQLYALIGDLGLGPALADLSEEPGDLETMWIYLRRRQGAPPSED